MYNIKEKAIFERACACVRKCDVCMYVVLRESEKGIANKSIMRQEQGQDEREVDRQTQQQE